MASAHLPDSTTQPFPSANDLGLGSLASAFPATLAAQLQIKECVIQRVPTFAGFGFNLHTDRARSHHLVGTVDPGSPAQKAGLQTDDLVLVVNGVQVDGMDHQSVVGIIKKTLPDAPLTLVVQPVGTFNSNELPNIDVGQTKTESQALPPPPSYIAATEILQQQQSSKTGKNLKAQEESLPPPVPMVGPPALNRGSGSQPKADSNANAYVKVNAGEAAQLPNEEQIASVVQALGQDQVLVAGQGLNTIAQEQENLYSNARQVPKPAPTVSNVTNNANFASQVQEQSPYANLGSYNGPSLNGAAQSQSQAQAQAVNGSGPFGSMNSGAGQGQVQVLDGLVSTGPWPKARVSSDIDPNELVRIAESSGVVFAQTRTPTHTNSILASPPAATDPISASTNTTSTSNAFAPSGSLRMPSRVSLPTSSTDPFQAPGSNNPAQAEAQARPKTVSPQMANVTGQMAALSRSSLPFIFQQDGQAAFAANSRNNVKNKPMTFAEKISIFQNL